jgi:PAS domain S-box-containing protein
MSPEDLCARVVSRAGAGVIVERPDGTVVEANDAACRMLGYTRAELVGRSYAVLCAPEDRPTQATLRAALAAGKRASHVGRWRYVRQNGTTLVADVITSRAADVPHGASASGNGNGNGHGSETPHVVSVLHERLATASDDPVPDASAVDERLESLGMLAGGVAHDFNNVLAVVRGNLEFARDALEESPPDVRTALVDLHAVERAADRATSLVRQLLAFGRMQTRSPESLDLNAVMRDVAPILRLSIGGEIHLALRLAPALPRVLADRTQVEQVLMNLVVNARDAVVEALARAEAEGRDGLAVHGVTVTTSCESLDEARAARVGVPRAGDYVRVAVHDTGIGMTDETRARIFEPFFTTKSVDRGTGLGLAATWGMVRQSGGAIDVETRYGEGSTFGVYFPAVVAPATDEPQTRQPASTTPAAARVPRAVYERRSRQRTIQRTVLLAEDDHAVRRVNARVLRAANYRVLEAGDGAGALELWRAHSSEIDALVADMRMPRLGGETLARIVTAEHPGFPVVLMTGGGGGAEELPGTESGAEERRARVDVTAPLGKPVSGGALLARLDALLPNGKSSR